MNYLNLIQQLYLPMDENGLTILTVCAKNNQNDAVQLLLKNGGMPKYVTYGYALAGEHEKVMLFIKTLDASCARDCLASAITGYARVGNEKVSAMLYQHTKGLGSALLGYAQSGNDTKVCEILHYRPDLYENAVEGYASCNHKNLLIHLITGTRFMPEAIYYAARSGNQALTNELLATCGVSKDYIAPALSQKTLNTQTINIYSLMNRAAVGYCAGCHYKPAGELISRGANVTHCLDALKNTNGIPNKERLLALLAHIDSHLSRTIYQRFGITENDTHMLFRTQLIMKNEKLCYIDAIKFIEKNEAETITQHTISVNFLVARICEELEADIKKTQRHM